MIALTKLINLNNLFYSHFYAETREKRPNSLPLLLIASSFFIAILYINNAFDREIEEKIEAAALIDSKASIADLSSEADFATIEELSPTQTTSAEKQEIDNNINNVIHHTLAVGAGDTLLAMLTKAGVKKKEAYDAIKEISKVFSPRDLKIGQTINLELQPHEDGEHKLSRIYFDHAQNSTIMLKIDQEGQLSVEKLIHKVIKTNKVCKGKINTNLSQDALNSGLPSSVLHQVIKMFSPRINLKQALQKNDHFTVIYEDIEDQNSGKLTPGNLICAELICNNKPYRIYRFEYQPGKYNFYNERGEAISRTIFRKPIEGATIGSPFGWRKDPVQMQRYGRSAMRFHKGVDFNARAGTRVCSSAKGVVERAGLSNSYGKYVLIRHENNYSTFYAHLQRFAKGLVEGTAVDAGQPIGYVGATGRVTGPHLHYELWLNNKPIKPEMEYTHNVKLSGNSLRRFIAFKGSLDAKLIGSSKSNNEMNMLNNYS